MKYTSTMCAMTSVTKNILVSVLSGLGGCDIATDSDGALKVSNSRLSVNFLNTGTIAFISKLDRVPHTGYYDSHDPEQVANMISWVKTVMEA